MISVKLIGVNNLTCHLTQTIDFSFLTTNLLLLFSDEGGAGGQEFVVELQETVLVSEGEGESMAVHRFAPDELVIQDAVEDVVSEYVHCDEDEDVAVETCVMALDGEEEGVAMGDIPEDGLDHEQQEDDQDGCGDYLMISCKSAAPLGPL